MFTPIDSCKPCRNRKTCRAACPGLLAALPKDKGCKELLPPPNLKDESLDYKQTLIDQQAAKRAAVKVTIGDIRQVNDTRQRLILAALYADISQADTARHLGISPRTLRRIVAP